MSASLEVKPVLRLSGAVEVPGDKSISHRAAMLAALASGTSTIDNFLCSEDCLCTLAAVAALGAGVARDGTRVRIAGTGAQLRPPAGPLDLGNSGTGMRLLTGLLAGRPFVSELTGDASLRSRPMRRIREPLERMGARIELTGARGTAPIRIHGGALQGIDYRLPVASAQVKSCVLLAGLSADGITTIAEPRPTRDHTETLLRAMGVPVTVEGPRISLAGGAATLARLRGREIRVPGDFSSAAFWLTAAACRTGWRMTALRVGLNPRRTALLDVLRRMGARVDVVPADVEAGAVEPVGTVTVTGAGLKGTEVGGDEIPNLIDELPLVMVAGALAEGTTVIRDAAELRVKESDRIAVMAETLRRFGIDAVERPDGMLVTGGQVPRGDVAVDSGGDHRVAMCAAVLGLLAEGPVQVTDTACIATSYPTFVDDLRRLGALYAGT